MVLVFILWYVLKHWFAASRDTPLQRGVYEALFNQLHNYRPEMWTRQGPREYLVPSTYSSRWKWWLVTRWTTGDAIPRAPTPEDEPIGVWNRTKRYLIKRWTAEIELSEDVEASIAPNGQLATALRQSVNPAIVPASGLPRRSSEDTDLTPVNESGEDRPGILVEEREEKELKDPIPVQITARPSQRNRQ
jgi:hypothetical protein